jgi:hypothetical protein
MYLLQVW